MARTNKIRKATECPTTKMERTIGGSGLPAVQIGRGLHIIVDAPSFEGEKNKSGSKAQTLRKLTRIDRLKRAGILDDREAKACEIYHEAFEGHYETRIKIADWSATGGSSDRAYGHWPTSMPLEPGMNMYQFLRAGISPIVLPMFERVVIHGRPLGKLAITFRHAARQLLSRLEGCGAI